MKKKIIALSIAIITIGATLTGCNAVTRTVGGTSTVTLPENKKLIEATWKESNLWYLVRDMREDEKAETYEFIEDSNCGVLEGKVIFKEVKKDKK